MITMPTPCPPFTKELETPLGRVSVIACDQGIASVTFTSADHDRDSLDSNPPLRGSEQRLNCKAFETGHTFNAAMSKCLDSLAQLRWANDLPLVLEGTPFQITVWKKLLQIPAGETQTYQSLAKAIGKPTAIRAVATACAANRIAFLIPCHRVIRSDGTLGGYRWGIRRKRWLLDLEQGLESSD
jgi:AraC family transcriptional regulator of adaptative response/methylated-DNA-[protein]-cysteine methyltransferase